MSVWDEPDDGEIISQHLGNIKEALESTKCLSKDGKNVLIKNCARCGSIIFDNVSSCLSQHIVTILRNLSNL